MQERAKRSAHEAKIQSEKSDDREKHEIDDHPAVLDEQIIRIFADGRVPDTVVLETTDEPQRQRIPQTRRSEARPHKQQTTLL